METMTLKELYEEYKSKNPKARIRTVADALGVSELELLEISPVKELTYLGDNFKGILQDMHELGEVMALTRNEHAVHETKGVYGNVSFMEKAPMGLAHNEIIDLRYFMTNWAHVYAVVFESGKRVMHSIQIFDKYGDAVHKIYATKGTDLDAYDALVKRYRVFTPRDKESIALKVEKQVTEELTVDIDVAAFQKEWLEMKDTHDFFGMLRKYKLSRQQAFRNAPAGTTYQVEKNSIVKMLEAVAENQTPIMVFLGNAACLQIYSGEVKKLVDMNGWYNVLDNKFNLHLKLESINEAWVVKKYTSDGIVTSLELFDEAGKQILYCFGKRKPGIPELEAWRTVVAKLPQLN